MPYCLDSRCWCNLQEHAVREPLLVRCVQVLANLGDGVECSAHDESDSSILLSVKLACPYARASVGLKKDSDELTCTTASSSRCDRERHDILWEAKLTAEIGADGSQALDCSTQDGALMWFSSACEGDTQVRDAQHKIPLIRGPSQRETLKDSPNPQVQEA